MPTRNIVLTPEQDTFVDAIVGAGEYRDVSEVVSEALRAMRARREEDKLRLERLRVAVAQGVAALDRGAYTEVADADLDAYLDGLAETASP